MSVINKQYKSGDELSQTHREQYVVKRLKLEIEEWFKSYGSCSIGVECVEPLHKLIDDTHEEIIRVRKENHIPDRC
jgi:hypothetical protein